MSQPGTISLNVSIVACDSGAAPTMHCFTDLRSAFLESVLPSLSFSTVRIRCSYLDVDLKAQALAVQAKDG